MIESSGLGSMRGKSKDRAWDNQDEMNEISHNNLQM